MATIREYYDTDPVDLTVHADWQFATKEGTVLGEIRAKVAYDFDANAKFWYMFVPDQLDAREALAVLLGMPIVDACMLKDEGDGVEVLMGHSDYSERQSASTLMFTKRMHFYTDSELSVDQRRELVALAKSKGIYLCVKDREYARKRAESESPLAFISHDSRDKDELVRELAHSLVKLMCPVWYDEFTLKVGDSLRQSIETGLKEARKCVLVLSPSFLGNKGWGRAEFDSVFTREILEQSNVILPVWHNVGVKEIYEYSPRLADKVGLSSALGVQEVARRLAGTIKSKT
ncbi:toll/interleukin-1 receptor domain-containing protein [Haloferula chungangensis]|uniref:Toll/interleukin-1 receptor domain-containing protein n=1 Tax=Haloferula chungangensis TaxID=1048331 RepID=A0ABW2LB28_9BACT